MRAFLVLLRGGHGAVHDGESNGVLAAVVAKAM
jgi:hypothetical protein